MPGKTAISSIKDNRLIALDALRGIIMVIMAIDHASFFIAKIHHSEFWGISMPHYEQFLPFFTRGLTHLSAPGFFFLMGAGMILFAGSRRRVGWSENKITIFFMTRGLLLIFTQLFIENPAWVLGALSGEFQVLGPPGGGGQVILHFGVLYGLGANLIMWSLLLRTPIVLIAAVSFVSIFLTHLYVPDSILASQQFHPLLRLILIPGQSGIWQVLYPLLPWAGITGTGIIFGKLLQKNKKKLFSYLPFTGAVFLILFAVIRIRGGWGNFHPWETGWISFFNVTKYPPSMSFILLTLGLNLLLLSLLVKFEDRTKKWLSPLLIFGRTAFFFYIIHLYIYALIGFAFPQGASYLVLYLGWCAGLILLYPLCSWYGVFKQKKPRESLWRFF